MSEGRPELPSGQEPQPSKPVALWPSSVALAGEELPPKRPASYLAAADAYAFVSTLPYAVVMQIATGETPADEMWGDRLLAMQYVRAARELLSTKGNPVEINARMDGPIKQLVEKKGNDTETAAILALLASLQPLPAQRRTSGEDE